MALWMLSFNVGRFSFVKNRFYRTMEQTYTRQSWVNLGMLPIHVLLKSFSKAGK